MLFPHMLPHHFSERSHPFMLPQVSPPVLLRGTLIFIQTMLSHLNTEKLSHTAQAQGGSKTRKPAFEFQFCYLLIGKVTYSVCARFPNYNLGILMAPPHMFIMGIK